MTELAERAALRRVTPLSEIRSHFPALERMHNGFPVAYFDGPGGTQVPRAVADAVTGYLFHHNANTHWEYPTSAETDSLLEDARETFADFLNAGRTEIAFGANMTTLAFHLSRTIGRSLGIGDEMVITELDHHANVAPWQALARERGVTVRVVKMKPETGQLDWDDLEQNINRRTKLLAIGAASNALGTITDVQLAAEIAHSFGALVFVDAVHYAPHALMDVREMNCDFLSCSAYKFYGPHVGLLYGKQQFLESLDFPKLIPAPDTAPERVETGTQNHEGIVGAAAAVDFLASLAETGTRRERLEAVFSELHSRGAALFKRMRDGLSSIDGVILYGPPAENARTPTLSFTVSNCASTEVARRLARRGIFASHGDFYAATVVERCGQAGEGFVRAGCACYTTAEEIERLVDSVKAISGGRE